MTDTNPSQDVPKDLPYANRGDLTNGSVPRHLFRLTLPMIWGIFAIISVQIADTYFIAKLGTVELAAISFTFPVTLIVTHLLFGVNISMASVVSRLIGAKEKDDARRVVLHGLMLALGVSGMLALGGYLLLDPIFSLLGADETTMPIIREYMPIWFIGSVFLSLPSAGNSAIRASGDALIPALIMSVVALLNLILDPLLIFGLLGFPALGVKGAAIGSLSGYLAGMGLGLYVLIFKKNLLCRDGLHLDRFKDSMRRLIFIALPAGLTNIIMPATTAFVVSLLAVHGEEVVAAHGIAGRVEAFTMVAVIGLATAMTPVIGQNWGAKKYDRVNGTINLAIGFNVVWSLCMAALLALFARPVAQAFSDDPAVVHYATLFFWIVPVTFAFGNLVYGWASAFNAIGKPQRSFVMIVGKSLMLALAAYAGDRLYGVTGVFCAIATVNVTAGILFHLISWNACRAMERSRLQAQEPAEPAAS